MQFAQLMKINLLLILAKKCFNEIKELEHQIISKEEFETYLNQ